MRSSLSCEFCRRSKIKCVNAGSPPCRKCEKSGRTDCQLTRPQVNATGRASKRARRDTGEAFDASLRSSVEQDGVSQQVHLSAPQSRGPATPSQGSVGPEYHHGHRRDEMDRHLQSIPKDLVFTALEAFWRKFPELRVIHPSSFMQDYGSNCSRESKALLATVLAMTKTQNPDSDRLRTQILYPSERYAVYASEILAACILQSPDVKVIQALLILTLFEWGTRDFHKAWMHCGIAIRMMQLLHSSRVAPFPLEIPHRTEPNDLTMAIETRTFWACFVMDCMVSSGTYNPRVLPKQEMAKLNVPRPPTSTEFALGSGSVVQSEENDSILTPGGSKTSVYLDLDNSFGVMADGFDIYSDCMAFVFNDGRRAPGMCLPENSLEDPPKGPIDPPLLEDAAPPGYWDESAREFFGAAQHLGSILQEASDCGVAVMTPFAGFCAFSSCFVNLYGFTFPRITLGYAPRAEELMNTGIEYLKSFSEVWDLGDGWLKTIQSGSLMYKRVMSNNHRYRGLSRFNFNVLHQSVHEFRVVDRSAQHLEEINNAERNSMGTAEGDNSSDKEQQNPPAFSTQALIDPDGNIDDQGLWPNWWSMLEEVNAAEIFTLT
ncbi:putative transcriptional regulatory protein [Colletotrichum asianum]|uniref:Putative transcriptional regulatory protein n=1 Tax=Colletotrichum asianum TaxID=702518 RepID=A0A8H3ZSW5_9PEZI|nr:putative transcriptional regulatory protein [Colletotrichum asianum]